jgi:hypothetical protein
MRTPSVGWWKTALPWRATNLAEIGEEGDFS